MQRCLTKYLADKTVEINKDAADANDDDVINIKDVARLIKHIADPSVPLGKTEQNKFC